jgi:hypothetical protein
MVVALLVMVLCSDWLKIGFGMSTQIVMCSLGSKR